MKTKLLIAFLLVLFLTGSLFALDRKRKINPIGERQQPILTESFYNSTQAMDVTSRRLVYVSYVAGFVDAMELNYIDSGAARKFVEDYNDLTLGDLIDSMVSFKDQHSQWRNVSPAVMLTVIIPRVNKGLAAFPEKQ